MGIDDLRTLVAAAVGAAALMLGGTGVPVHAAAPTEAVVDGLRLDDRSLLFSVTVPSAPVGTRLDPAATTVEVGGVEADVRSDVLGEPGTVPAVVLVLDRSGSMQGAALDAAKQAASTFVSSLPAAVPVGLVTFSDSAGVDVQPTTDHARIRSAVLDIEAVGETALFDAVVAAAALPAPEKTLVVLSDGGDTASTADLTTAVTAVTSSGARVEAIALQTDEFDLAPLSSVAAAGHGTVRTVEDGTGLVDAFGSTTASLSSRLGVVAVVPEGVSGTVDVEVTVGDGTSQWSGRAQVAIPAPEPTAAPDAAAGSLVPQALPTAAPSRTEALLPWVIGVSLALAVLLMVLALVPQPKSDRRRRQDALSAYTLTGGPRARAALPAEVPNALVQQVLDASEKVVDRTGSSSATALKLDRAGMALRPHEWLVLQGVACLVASAATALLTGWVLRALLVGTAVGWTASVLYLRWRQSRRTNRFAEDLPDTLQLVASSLRTGFSLPQALDSAQTGAADPMSSELGRALAATRIGSNLEDELERVAVRMRSEDWNWAVMAVRIQRQVGGNLAEVLMTTVTTLRERAATRRQVQALSAEGRLSAYILIALPIALFVFLVWARPEYVSVLWTTLPGVVMLVLAVLLMVAGSFWMSRIVKVSA